jgi:hypothetical protein
VFPKFDKPAPCIVASTVPAVSNQKSLHIDLDDNNKTLKKKKLPQTILYVKKPKKQEKTPQTPKRETRL